MANTLVAIITGDDAWPIGIAEIDNEETVMLKYGDPDIANHKVPHQDLIKRVLNISDRILTEGESEKLGDDVFEFLKRWLVDLCIRLFTIFNLELFLWVS